MRKEIRISGFGGQGIVTAGVILAKASALEGFEVLQTESYGSEARGGACRADVIISDLAINDLSIESPDILACMSDIALARYLPDLKPEGILIVNSDLVKTEGEGVNFGGTIKKVPATSIAGRSANIAMVAALASIVRVGRENLEAAVEDVLPEQKTEIAKMLGKTFSP